MKRIGVQKKKLQLNPEVIRILTTIDLGRVRGGDSPPSGDPTGGTTKTNCQESADACATLACP